MDRERMGIRDNSLSGMVRDAASGSFDFTSRLHPNTRKTARAGDPGLRRSVPLRMTGVCRFASAICCCVMLAFPGMVRALQSPQDAAQRDPQLLLSRPHTYSTALALSDATAIVLARAAVTPRKSCSSAQPLR